jgi:predicted metalloprotease with PDZ domain
MKSTLLGAVALAVLAGAAFAQSYEPEPAPPVPAVPAPQDIPYPGTITLAVDATDLSHHIFRAHETIPVKPGPLILLYPQWLPGDHSPTGELSKFSGLFIKANGQRLDWKRDPVDVYAFHVEVPEGSTSIDVDMQFDSAVESSEGRVMMTPQMLSLEWEKQLLYPAGYFSRDIPVDASVTLPSGWSFGTALETQSTAGDTTSFKEVPLDTLVDSPMIAGKYFERVDLSPTGPVPVHIDIVADRPDELVIPDEAHKALLALVDQAYKLYGSHHYDHYDFLFSLSGSLGDEGLEHHRSSEDGTSPRYFLDWKEDGGDDLLSHEYTHSWNGKFRRPADLWTPNFNVPMRDSLLWVYEGQTQYWGNVLAARSGLVNHKRAYDALAYWAAVYDHQVGRAWKNLQDTTNDPIVAMRRPIPWGNWQRSEDYYIEGQLTWLDADTLIRQLSKGKKSLDDFAKTFFGIENGSYADHTYTFDDVVKALNAVEPYDWAKFLNARLTDHADGAPLGGLARGGYKLVYNDTPNEFDKLYQKRRHFSGYLFSLGFTVDSDGTLKSVQYDSPAFAAGLAIGSKIVAVNGEAYGDESLSDALNWAKEKKTPIALLVEDQMTFRTVEIPYYGGALYPHLEPTGKGARSIDAIYAAKK